MLVCPEGLRVAGGLLPRSWQAPLEINDLVCWPLVRDPCDCPRGAPGLSMGTRLKADATVLSMSMQSSPSVQVPPPRCACEVSIEAQSCPIYDFRQEEHGHLLMRPLRTGPLRIDFPVCIGGQALALLHDVCFSR